MLIMTPSVCSDLWQVWNIVGWVLWVFKIVIPILIILFGMIDLGKAVVASKDDEIKKAIKSLAMRAIAGIVIFFIPTLVSTVFKLVDNFQEVKGEYDVCASCVNHPGDSCKTSAQTHCTSLGGTWDADTGCTTPTSSTTPTR